jgi:hypothetical protein
MLVLIKAACCPDYQEIFSLHSQHKRQYCQPPFAHRRLCEASRIYANLISLIAKDRAGRGCSIAAQRDIVGPQNA